MAYENALRSGGYTEDEEEQSVSLLFSNFVIAMKSFVRLIIILTAIGLIAGIIFGNFFYKPKYETSASFAISNSYSGDNNFGFNTSLDEQLVTAETYVMTSTTLKNMIVEKLGENYQNSVITAESISDTPIVTVKVTSDSKAKAYLALKEVINVFPVISQKVYGDVQISLIDQADASDSAVNAFDKQKYAILFALTGLCVSLAIVFVYSLNFDLVSDSDTLRKYVNLDCIGTIPQCTLKNKKKESDMTILNRNATDEFKESFQFIRTRMERMCRNTDSKSLMVTSTYPGEGKTTVAVNLALSLTQNGKKVIIIDCDLRNPSVMERLGIKNYKYGLDDYFRNKCEFGETIVQFPRTEIYAVATRKSMSNAAEIINSSKMQTIIKKACEKADYVIVDTPPTDMMGDSVTISKVTDAALFVVRQNYSRMSGVVSSLESINESSPNLFGFLLNDKEVKLGVVENKYGQYGSYSKYGKYNKYSEK